MDFIIAFPKQVFAFLRPAGWWRGTVNLYPGDGLAYPALGNFLSSSNKGLAGGRVLP